MPARPNDAARERVIGLLEPVVAATGADLVDVELRTVGRRLVVRVLVERGRGISLDEVAEVSRAVSDALDGSSVLGNDAYTLEVSSPGIDRPLTLERHWLRNVGRLVNLTLADGTKVTGRLLSHSADAGEIVIELDVKGRKSTRTVPLADIRRAVVEVEFSRSAAEGDDGDVPEDDVSEGSDADDDADDDAELDDEGI